MTPADTIRGWLGERGRETRTAQIRELAYVCDLATATAGKLLDGRPVSRAIADKTAAILAARGCTVSAAELHYGSAGAEAAK